MKDQAQETPPPASEEVGMGSLARQALQQVARGQWASAQEWAQSVSLDDPILENLWSSARIFRHAGELDEAIRRLEKLVHVAKDHTPGWELLGRCLVENGALEAAAEHFRTWHSLHPDHPIPPHLLAAATGENVPRRAAPDYLTATFDLAADWFDCTAEQQGYCGPEVVDKLLEEHLADTTPGSLRALDVGCGTGLIGSVVRPYAAQLEGIDLSPQMLDLARQRALYDHLKTGDLVDHLRDSTACYDLIVATDVFRYFGDLSTVLPACFAALKTEGWIIFSIAQGPLSNDVYCLTPQGHYVHSPHYLVLQMGEVGITGGTMRKVVLRKENERDVNALFIAVQRPKDELDTANNRG